MTGLESTTCPQCQGPRDAKALYCPFCGVVFSKLEQGAQAPRSPAARPPAAAPAAPVAPAQPPAPAAAAPPAATPTVPVDPLAPVAPGAPHAAPSPPVDPLAPPPPSAPASAPAPPANPLAPVPPQGPPAAPTPVQRQVPVDPLAPPPPNAPAATPAPPANPLAPVPPPAPPKPADPAQRLAPVGPAAPAPPGDLYEPPAAAPDNSGLPPELPQIYDGPLPAAAPPPAPQGGGFKRLPKVTSTDDIRHTPLSRNLLPSILAAGLIFILLQVFMVEHVGSGSEDLDDVRTAYTSATGLRPPGELTDATRITLLDHHILMLGDSNFGDPTAAEFPSFVITYHRGLLAGSADGETLKRSAQEKIEAFGIPLYKISDRTTELRGQQVPTEVYGVGDPEKPIGRVVYRTWTNPDGDPVLLVLGGTTRNVTKLTREYFS